MSYSKKSSENGWYKWGVGNRLIKNSNQAFIDTISAILITSYYDFFNTASTEHFFRFLSILGLYLCIEPVV